MTKQDHPPPHKTGGGSGGSSTSGGGSGSGGNSDSYEYNLSYIDGSSAAKLSTNSPSSSNAWSNFWGSSPTPAPTPYSTSAEGASQSSSQNESSSNRSNNADDMSSNQSSTASPTPAPTMATTYTTTVTSTRSGAYNSNQSNGQSAYNSNYMASQYESVNQYDTATNQSASSSDNGQVGGKLMGALLALLVFSVLIALFIIGKKRKKRNRGSGLLTHTGDKKKRRGVVGKATDSETVTSESISAIIPTCGRYRSAEGNSTEFYFKFANLEEDETDDGHYTISGEGYEKTLDGSQVGFIQIKILEGTVARDGTSAKWVEERRAFLDSSTSGQSITLSDRLSYFLKNGGVRGVPTTFSIDGEKVHQVESQGVFNFETKTFRGKWSHMASNGYLQDGEYNLAFTNSSKRSFAERVLPYFRSNKLLRPEDPDFIAKNKITVLPTRD